jgi:hypothetical protein
MKPSFTVRDLVYIAVFGALWGALEITLGAYLHVLFPPLADTFLIGVIMAGLGSVIVLVGRYFVPHTGAAIAIGIITALLKALSLGGVQIGPMVAILAEALLIELALLGARQPSLWRSILGGALAVSWNFFHKFVMMRLLYGRAIGEVYAQMVEDGSAFLGLDARQAVAIIVILLLIRVAVGAVAGWLGWDLGRLVSRRLARA